MAPKRRFISQAKSALPSQPNNATTQRGRNCSVYVNFRSQVPSARSRKRIEIDTVHVNVFHEHSFRRIVYAETPLRSQDGTARLSTSKATPHPRLT